MTDTLDVNRVRGGIYRSEKDRVIVRRRDSIDVDIDVSLSIGFVPIVWAKPIEVGNAILHGSLKIEGFGPSDAD